MLKEAKPNNGRRWDDEADAELTQRVAAGEFLPGMAKAMGRTQEALRSRANILGLPVRSSAQPRRAVLMSGIQHSEEEQHP